MQHTAREYNTLQHNDSRPRLGQGLSTYDNTPQRTATNCNTLQHSATLCKILQHTATYCQYKHSIPRLGDKFRPIIRTLQHTASHCKTLQSSNALFGFCCDTLHCKHNRLSTALQTQQAVTHCTANTCKHNRLRLGDNVVLALCTFQKIGAHAKKIGAHARKLGAYARMIDWTTHRNRYDWLDHTS